MTAVSVVIPTYNRRAYLRQSIESVRRQTVKDVEIIVVDDASDQCVADWLAAEPCGADIRVIRHAQNRGPGESRRTGVAAARGEYIAFLDDDDRAEPELLQTALGVLTSDPSIGLFCCDGLLIDEGGSALPGRGTFNGVQASVHGYPLRSGPRSLADVFLWPTVGIGFVARREVFRRVRYPADRWLEDYRFQLDVTGSGFRVYYHHEPLAHYRMHAGNTSGATPAMCAEMVACLEDARRRFPSLRRLGRPARRRLAQAWMDFAIASMRDRHRWQAVMAFCRAMGEYPAQGLAVLRFGPRWLLRRGGVLQRNA